MPIIDLYHGGEYPVLEPKIVSPTAARPLDFGSGFYTTTSVEQARRWVEIRKRQHVYEKGCVSHFILDCSVLDNGRIKVRVFNGPEEDWFDFVMANRHVDGFVHDYDIVMGPVANDNVYETLTLFEDGIITKSEAIARMRTYKLVNQLLFHSELAIACLKYIDMEKIYD